MTSQRPGYGNGRGATSSAHYPNGHTPYGGESALIGKRVRLVRCTDAYTRLDPGTEGTVDFVDSMGTVFVKWDNGSRLGLVREAGDEYAVIEGDA